MLSSTFNDAAGKLKDSGDTNFCVPLAFAVLLDRDAHEVAQEMIAKGYRKFRSGVYRDQSSRYAEEVGLELLDRSQEVLNYGGVSVKSLRNILPPNRSYLIFTSSHALAMIDGEVHDWTKDRKHRIDEVFEVKHEDGPGVLTPNMDTVTSKNRAQVLVNEVYRLTSYASVTVSGGEARLNYGYNWSCYIRKSRNGYTLQFGRSIHHRLYDVPNMVPKTTKQYVNYEFAELEEAVHAADDAMHGTRW